jgi:hypothetical protein
VPEHEGEHEHGDLQQDPHAGHLLLLPRRREGRRLRQPARRRRGRGQAQAQLHRRPQPPAAAPEPPGLARARSGQGRGAEEEVLESRGESAGEKKQGWREEAGGDGVRGGPGIPGRGGGCVQRLLPRAARRSLSPPLLLDRCCCLVDALDVQLGFCLLRSSRSSFKLK